MNRHVSTGLETRFATEGQSMNLLMTLGHDERGAATTEYALLLAVFSLAVVTVLTGLGTGITDVMAAVTSALDATPVDATTPAG